MSGDVQTRQRRKEKKKQKREDEAPLPGVDTSKFNETEKKNVQMHIHESDHHGDHGSAGICAKIIFFALMAILLGLVTLIVLENRGGSDVDTPLSESRFSEYLQGWVDENREEDHHDEPHFSAPDHDDDHDDSDHVAESHHDEEHTEINDDEPYPEEKDVSNNENDDDDDNSQELNAEINSNIESNQEDENDNASPENEENDQTNDDNDNNNDGDDDDNNDQNDNEPEGTNDNDDDDNDGLEENDNNEPEVPNLFEDSAPFDEENKINRHHLSRKVDELYDTYNEIADMLGKERLNTNKKPILNKRQIPKGDDDDGIADSKDIFENVVDNDAGEDILLQKLAEESVQEQQNQQQDQDENEEEGSSSLMVKLGVGVLLAIVAHQIIIKKISATNRSDIVDADLIAKENENALSKRRFTMLSNSEEQLVGDEIENEEIIEVMMISTPNVIQKTEEEEPYTESDIDEDELGEEEEDIIEEELEEEEYSEEIIDEFESEEFKSHVPQTFEDFHNMYKPQSEHIEEAKRKVTFDEPKAVEQEVEKEIEERILTLPESSNVQATPKSENVKHADIGQTEEGYEPDIDIEDEEMCEEEEELEEEEMSGDELMDEDDLDYEQSDDEDLSDIDDSDLLNRLEAKYGKISSNNDKSNEEENDDSSWTKIPEGGGAQSSYMEELLRQQALEENPVLKELYEKAKEMDITSENEKSNKKLIEAIEMYKTLIEQYGDKLNDTIFKQVGERCINRMRFLGKLKSAIDIHYKLIRRFSDEPSFRNQLAVTFLLGNRLSAAKLVLHEVLSQWRYNGFALVHYGFVLKNLDQDYENAVLYLKEGIETNEEGTQDGRFYFNLGDALQRLGRNEEAQEIYRKGAEIGLFLSEYQRSLYNVNRLKSKPFWTKLETTYKDEFTEILKYWQIIRDEGLKLLSQDGLFMNEQENLKDTGDWKQFELYARGTMTKNCQMAPITCQLIKHFKAASSCKRGQVKFSVLHPNTHVHSHCGPTNCRLRAHLGLKVPDNTFIRVANETKSWKEGEWLIFDDSYEHEVWQNGTSLRLVLIVDVWHPDLTEDEKSSMSPI